MFSSLQLNTRFRIHSVLSGNRFYDTVQMSVPYSKAGYALLIRKRLLVDIGTLTFVISQLKLELQPYLLLL